MRSKRRVGRDRVLIVIISVFVLALVAEIAFLTFGGFNVGRDPGRQGDSAPTWSADSTRIAFSSDETGDFDIFVMNADRTDRVDLTNREA